MRACLPLALLLTSLLSLPAEASVRRARFANGWGIAGVVFDLTGALTSVDVYDTPAETRENQIFTGTVSTMGRTMGLLGTARSAHHLEQLDMPVNRAPVIGAASLTVVGAMASLSTWDAGIGGDPRSTPDQALVASIRGGAAALVGVQAHLNRMGARTLDPPPRRVSALQLSVGPTHLSLTGAF